MQNVDWPIVVSQRPLEGEWLSATREKSTSFWRKEDPVLEYASKDKDAMPTIMQGGMFPHQRQWWNSQAFIKALVSGYGAGKTMIASKRAISLAIYNAPSPVLCISPTFKISRRTMLPTIMDLLRGKQTIDPHLKFTYNKSEFEFRIMYKNVVGIIWLLSGEDPDALKGSNAGAALIDEPFIQDKQVFNQVLARVRDPSAKKREICLTGTPETLNWGFDICEGEEKDNYDLELIQASTKTNLVLPQSYSETLESAYSEKAAMAYVEGKFVSLSTGLVYYAFNPVENVVILPDPGHEVYAGMDFNVNPMAFIVFWINGDHMHVIKEYELPNSDTEDAAIVLKKDWGNRLHGVYPDASGRARHTSSPGGRSDFTILEEHDIEVFAHSANPPRRDRYNAVNGKLKSKTRKPTLTFSPECKRLKRYMMEYSHELMLKQKAMSHLLDATGYPVAHLFSIRPEVGQIEVLGTAFM